MNTIPHSAATLSWLVQGLGEPADNLVVMAAEIIKPDLIDSSEQVAFSVGEHLQAVAAIMLVEAGEKVLPVGDVHLLELRGITLG